MNIAQFCSDPLYLSPSDSPGLKLTNVSFSGTNFLNWSRSVNLALSAKAKLGFVTSECSRPEIDSHDQQRWDRCDSMIRC